MADRGDQGTDWTARRQGTIAGNQLDGLRSLAVFWCVGRRYPLRSLTIFKRRACVLQITCPFPYLHSLRRQMTIWLIGFIWVLLTCKLLVATYTVDASLRYYREKAENQATRFAPNARSQGL